MNCRKSALWIVISAVAACAAAAVCFLTGPKTDASDMAGADDDRMISYNGNLYDKKDLSDDTISWLSWYNSLPEEQQQAVNHVPWDLYELAGYGNGSDMAVETSDAAHGEADTSPATPESQSAEAAIAAAILEKNAAACTSSSVYTCCDFVTLETVSATPAAQDTTHTVTYYGWALYQEYAVSETGIEERGGSHIPVALTFESDESGCHLKEYWEPRDGSLYAPDIRDKFPAHIVNDALDSQKYICQQIQSCYKQTIEVSGLDTDSVIRRLLDTVCTGANTSSSPQDYIDAEPIAYRELLYYGKYTLRYCFNRFQQGNETGLEGRIMAAACEEILQAKGKTPVDAATAETGQRWYEMLLASSFAFSEP